jgi:tetraacyldisaccharide 4'-kinase
MSVQSWLNRIWYAPDAPPWWLVPGSALYGALFAARRYAYRRHWRKTVRVSRPVVVVGNLSVGGTGKTPLVCWLAARLGERGLRPGVVTRGYGGSSRIARLVSPSDDPAVVGDEPVLLARRTRRPVAAGADRAAAAQLLVDAGCGVIISDDGLQHAALARDCEIVVIDGERGFGNGRLLPAGPLREPPNRLLSVDAAVVNGGDPAPIALGAPPFAPVPRRPPSFRMRLEASVAIALVDGSARALQAFAGASVHAIAGIGNPERFFAMLRANGMAVTAHPLADHARIAPDDILFPDDRPVLLTEKDAVKCGANADRRHWYVPVEARLDDEDSASLLEVVMAKIARAKD